MRLAPVLLFALLLVACAAERSAAPVAAGSDLTPKPTAPTPEAGVVITRYTCDANVRVDILRHGVASVALPDGRVVKLSRIANSAPLVFTGEALYFRIDDQQAYLSQDVGTELACREQ